MERPDSPPSSLEERRCTWCRRGLLATPRRRRFCGQRCRQSAFRLRRRRETFAVADRPLRFAYADPPYPGLAHLYREEPDFGGEVDHAGLVASLVDERYDGWALSTSSRSLRDVLPLCPPGVRVCAWVKPIAPSPHTYGLHSRWEPLIVSGGRKRRPGIRDWLAAQPARLGGETLLGRKPIAFCAWLFDCLGMLAGDELVDLFPGTGVVARAWSELSAIAPDDTSSPGVLERRPPVVDAGVGDASRSR